MKTILLTLGLALAIASCSSAKKEEKSEAKEVAKTELSCNRRTTWRVNSLLCALAPLREFLNCA